MSKNQSVVITGRTLTRSAGTQLNSGQSSVYLQDVIDAYGSLVAILAEDQTILYVNRAWREFACRTGLSADRCGVGCEYGALGMVTAASNQDATAVEAGLNSVLTSGETEFQTNYLSTGAGEEIWFRIRAASFFSVEENATVVLVSHEDITAEKSGKDHLEDKERINRLLDSTKIVPWEADAENWRMTYIGSQAESVFGYSQDRWFEPEFWIDHLHPDDKCRVLTESATFLQSTDPSQYEYRMISKDGRVIWIRDMVSVNFEKGIPTTISGFMVDISERKTTEDTLKLLSGRLITAQEDERKRIARELHDDLNQRMALISIELEQVTQMLTNRTDGVRERVKEVQRKAFEISKEIHRMSYKLHPSKLDDLGLVPALRSFCSELSGLRGLRINFHHEDFPGNIPADITLCLFRIAQEALQNAAKHSGEPQIDVALTVSDGNLTLTVSDAGSGFDINKRKTNEGLGFISMRERLRLINGALTIHSKPMLGTRITAAVPMHDARNAVSSFRPTHSPV